MPTKNPPHMKYECLMTVTRASGDESNHGERRADESNCSVTDTTLWNNIMQMMTSG